MLQKSHLLRPNDPNVLSEAVCNMEHAWPIVKDVKHRYDGSSFHRIPCLSTSEYAEGLQVLCSFLVALWHHNDWQSCACFSESPCFFWHGIDLRSSTFSLGRQGVSLAKNHRIQLHNLFLAQCRLTVFVRCTTRKFRCLFPLLFHSTDHCLTIGP